MTETATMADDSSAPMTDPHASATPPVPATGADADAPHSATPAPEQASPAPPEPDAEAPATAPYPDITTTAAPAKSEAPARSEPPPRPPVAAPAPEPPENKKRWYVVKVQSGREDTIKEAIERRVRKEGLEEFYGQIVIPVEKVTEVKTDKNGKRVTRTKERKLYPGYLMCEVEYNDRILYLFRETSGVGDFVGAQPGKLDQPPTPMSDREVQKMLGPQGSPDEAPTPTKPKDLDVGDRVRVVDGIFNGMEGSVKQILESVGRVQVEVTIFGRPTAVDLEYYQVERL